MSFLNAAARRRVDLRWLRGRLDPGSQPGRALADRVAPAPLDDLDAWRDDQRAVRALEAQVGASDALARALDGLPAVASMLAVVEAGGVPDAPDLFRLQRFVGGARRAAEALEAAGTRLDTVAPGQRRALPTPGELAAWLAELTRAPDAARFTILPHWVEGLGDARSALRAAEAERARRRAERLEAVEARYGLRVNARGELHVAAASPHLHALRADPALRRSPAALRGIEVYALAPVDGSAEVEAMRRRVDALEQEALARIAERFRPRVHALRALEDVLAWLDVALARIRLRAAWDGCWPEPGAALEIVDGRHPRVEARLRREGRAFVPVSLRVGDGPAVLTGPNMGGKSVVLEMALLGCALAHAGLPVPAARFVFAPRAHVAWVGAERDEREAGLSSFAAEVVALREALAQPGPALLLCDEFGRGTNADEGSALAEGLVRALAHEGRPALLATHFALRLPEGASAWRVKGLEDAPERAFVADGGDWMAALAEHMDYRLVPDEGTSIARDAVRIAACAGLPGAIVDAARERLAEQPRSNTNHTT